MPDMDERRPVREQMPEADPAPDDRPWEDVG